MTGGRRSSGDIVRLAEYQVDRPTVDYPSDGGGSDPESMLRGMPARIGRYTVLDLLGVGGMGVVCTAWDPKLDRKIALKLLRRKSNADDSRISTSQARLVREAKSLARLSHPNIITVHDVDTYEGQIYMAMEYVDGPSLDQWVVRGERPWRDVVQVFIDAARGLAAAHASGIIHRDFKPANVLLGKDGRVMVVDFGLAKSNESDEELAEGDAPEQEEPDLPGLRLREQGSPLDEVLGTTQNTKLTQVGRTVGTPAYMAPEQFLGLPVGPETDQFSFGVALFEALYGYLPFPDESRDELIDRVTEGKVNDPPKDTVVPGWVHRVVLRALQPRPENRHSSMDELIVALQADPAKRRRRVLAVGGGLVLLGLGGYGVVQGLSPDLELCSGAGDRMDRIWGSARQTEIEEAFAATERAYAQDAWERVEAELDQRATAWVDLHTDVCEATAVRGEQSPELMDVRMACLDRHHGEMRALVDVFAQPDDRVVEEAVNAVQALGDLQSCRTMSADEGMAPIDDPVRQAEADAIQDLLAQSKAMRDTGDLEVALAHAVSALERARELGHKPLLARAALVHAECEGDRNNDDEVVREYIVEALELAVETEQAALEAEAWSKLIVLDSESGHHEAALARLLPARMAVTRTRDDRVEGIFASAEGTALYKSGQHDEAFAAMTRALESYEAVYGTPHPKVAAALNNMGAQYFQRGFAREGRHYLGQAAVQMEEIYGPHHPLVGRIHFNLGKVALEDQGADPATARGELQRAVDILRRSLPHGHNRTLTAMAVLAMAEEADGAPERAVQRHNEILSIIATQQEPNLVFKSKTLVLLGDVERRRARVAALDGDVATAEQRRRRAARSFEEALSVCEAIEACDSLPETAHLSYCLLEIDRDRPEEAINHCRTVWDLQRRGDAINNDGIEAVQELAAQLQLLGRTDSAIRALREAVELVSIEQSVSLRLELADLLWPDPKERSEVVAMVQQARSAPSGSVEADELKRVERWLRLHPLP